LVLQAKQLVHSLKSRSYRWTSSVWAPCAAAPSRAFATRVAVFHCLRGLPLIPMTCIVYLLLSVAGHEAAGRVGCRYSIYCRALPRGVTWWGIPGIDMRLFVSWREITLAGR